MSETAVSLEGRVAKSDGFDGSIDGRFDRRLVMDFRMFVLWKREAVLVQVAGDVLLP